MAWYGAVGVAMSCAVLPAHPTEHHTRFLGRRRLIRIRGHLPERASEPGSKPTVSSPGWFTVEGRLLGVRSGHAEVEVQ